MATLATSKASAQNDSAAPGTVLGIRYFLPANKVPYLSVTTKLKVGRKFEPVKAIPVSVYLNEPVPGNLMGKIITGITGEGRVAIPASFKACWDSLSEFKFIAISDPSAGKESLASEITIKKAILVIDTISEDGVRTVIAQLREKTGNDWGAVKEIEMKLGIKRAVGSLPVAAEETYTSDSTGIAATEFKKDSMPGDTKGNLVLVAIVEDNDTYGNLAVEKAVPWGKPLQVNTHFWHRTLWSTGGRAPVWLLFIAISIIVGVWGVLVYLITQFIKIRKLGKAYESNLSEVKT